MISVKESLDRKRCVWGGGGGEENAECVWRGRIGARREAGIMNSFFWQVILFILSLRYYSLTFMNICTAHLYLKHILKINNKIIP